MIVNLFSKMTVNSNQEIKKKITVFYYVALGSLFYRYVQIFS